MDPLSEVFSLVYVRRAATARFEAGGDWALRFPEKPNLKFNTVLRGHCWIIVPPDPPRMLQEGDTFLLANAPPFVLASDPGLDPAEADAAVWDPDGYRIRYNGSDTVVLGGGFVFDSDNAQFLLESLAPYLHIPGSEPAAAALRRTLEILDDELRTQGMGGSLVTRGLADVLLVQALRAFVAVRGHDSAGWIGALNDRRIGAALRLMHSDVGRRWTVGELASNAGMSRSAFALRFRQLVGAPPLDYLMRWRMQFARDALRRSECSVGDLAARFGYTSESAFGSSFKRVFGRAPRRYWSGR